MISKQCLHLVWLNVNTIGTWLDICFVSYLTIISHILKIIFYQKYLLSFQVIFISLNWFCCIWSYCIMILTLCTTLYTNSELLHLLLFVKNHEPNNFARLLFVRKRIFPFLYLNHFLVVRLFSDNVGLPWIFVFDSCRTQ